MTEPALRAQRAEREPAIRRLAAIAPLDEAAEAALVAAVTRPRLAKPRRELVVEGTPVTEMLLVLSGWAARLRLLEDGRRQIMGFVLPGELIGNCHQSEPVAVSTVVALTEVEFCAAPPRDDSPALAEAYAVSYAMEEAYLLAHITRLGRLNAEERLADLLLELLDRLSLAGLASADSFALPLTQEMLADTTGLTPVHVNRMLQQLRQQDIAWRGGRLTFRNSAELAERVGWSRVRVAESAAGPSG